jgi:hypothetical protein
LGLYSEAIDLAARNGNISLARALETITSRGKGVIPAKWDKSTDWSKNPFVQRGLQEFQKLGLDFKPTE